MLIGGRTQNYAVEKLRVGERASRLDPQWPIRGEFVDEWEECVQAVRAVAGNQNLRDLCWQL